MKTTINLHFFLTSILLLLFGLVTLAQEEAIRFEAEGMDDLGDFTIENKAGASDFKVIRASSENNFSTATSTFTGQPGIYTIHVNYLDEGDGEATYNFLQGENIVTTWVGDQIPKDDAFVERIIPGVSLTTGQQFSIQARRGDGEWGRIDYIDFYLESSDDGSSFIVEAEDCELNNLEIKNELSDFTGTGYTLGSETNSDLNFTIENDSASWVNMRIRYQSFHNNYSNASVINNGNEQEFNFIPSEQFGDWQEQIVLIFLNEGNNILQLQGSNLPAIDRFLLQRTNPETLAPIKVSKTAPQNKIVLDTAFTISWLGVENAQQYKVYFGTNSTLTESDLLGETSLNHIDVAAQPDDTYYWRVDAINASGTTAGNTKTLTFKANASVYYVAPDGNNTNDGTIEAPFQTIIKALNLVMAGDTVFVREGEYRFVRNLSINSLGNAKKWITIKAYNNENVVFNNESNGNRGIEIGGEYIHLKGIDVTLAGDNGIYVDGKHIIVEECHTYRNGDSGIQLTGGASYVSIINCDSYLNFDPDNKGENADGFAAKFDLGPGNEFIGCRAWSNSDDGWDFWQAEPSIYLENCWAFANGYDVWDVSGFNGDGNGFKLGGDYYKGPHKLVRCAAFHNRGKGFDQNHNMAGCEIIHCSSYDNQVANYRLSENPTEGKHRLVNNLSFDGKVDMASSNEEITNSWNGLTLTEDDFATLDSTGVSGPRNEKGELPELYFLKLRIGSSAVDAGTNMGFVFEGNAPDLGAFEGAFEKQEVNAVKYYSDLFSCYPNPVNDILKIKLIDTEAPTELELIGISGKVYFRSLLSGKQLTSIDVSQYPQGMYLLKAIQNNHISTQTIVIQ